MKTLKNYIVESFKIKNERYINSDRVRHASKIVTGVRQGTYHTTSDLNVWVVDTEDTKSSSTNYIGKNKKLDIKMYQTTLPKGTKVEKSPYSEKISISGKPSTSIFLENPMFFERGESPSDRNYSNLRSIKNKLK